MFKLMTLNCSYDADKHGPWKKRRALIKDVILKSRPDVVALQAVKQDNENTGLDQALEIAERVDYSYVVFQAAEQAPDGSEPGQAFICRHPVHPLDAEALPNIPGSEDLAKRQIFPVEVSTVEGQLYIFNAHCSWVKDQCRRQAEAAVRFMEKFPAMKVLVGDLNAAPDSGIPDILKANGWIDMWEDRKKEDPGLTFESDHPFTRIDYAWINEQLKPHAVDIEIIRAESPDGKVRLSDHLGLLVSLDLHVKTARRWKISVHR